MFENDTGNTHRFGSRVQPGCTLEQEVAPCGTLCFTPNCYEVKNWLWTKCVSHVIPAWMTASTTFDCVELADISKDWLFSHTQFIVYLLFAPLEALMRCFFCVAKMTEWYIMFVKQVMWVPSTSSISFLNLLRPLFSWLVYFLFSFFATHSASAIWCVSQNGRFHGWHGSESHRCPQSMVLCNVKLGWMWDIFPLDICKKGYYGWSSKSETNSQGAGGNLAQVEILVFVIFWGSILDICWLVQHWVSLVVQWVCLQFLDVSLFAISIDQRTSDMKKVPCLLNGSV